MRYFVQNEEIWKNMREYLKNCILGDAFLWEIAD
nr:MAG TPA: hypothetical protein [Herelleviridae sp.]